MFFRQLHDQTTQALSYVLGDTESSEAAVVDPQSGDAQLVLALLEDAGLVLRYVLRTHTHHGIVTQIPLPARVVGGTLHQSPACESSRLALGNDAIHILATPGHTTHCLSFLWHDRLFCGDALAVRECHQEPYAADPEQLWDSVTRVMLRLPGETLLFGAHAVQGRMVSNVHEQRLHNDLFSQPSRDACLTRLMTMRGEAFY